uniref:ADP-ribosyl cyclase/cyclic ADP-ribose hydrolase n=1 Tax=Populus trichocarpa TaxID=3694 RepID=A0A3N7F9S9_POPTR|eukprot:XP_024448125.1 disease resistance protein TAO1 isoform X3 [Populus trichocarpa]
MASSSSPTTPYLKHEVFLSFRGTDTRNSFTSHLYDALQRNQIDAYIDNKLDGGEKIEPALLERIEESFISLVIFSENYADSTFCLRELSKILECMETKQQMVLPVFYQLDPSHVQNLTGSYGDALCKHERDRSSEEVESWRRALKEIANLKGWDSNVIKDETKLIQEIVSDIQKKLSHELSLSFEEEGLVGMESRVEDIESLLSFGSTGVLIVGIWGMGGIGKSTTADFVYRRNRSKFEGHCCFRNVREESRKHGVDHVRQKILGDVLEKKDMTIRTIVLPPDTKRMLQRKKVLIVLDDVNDPQDLKYLLGDDGLFGQGSRIMVTSRDRQVLINACDEDKIYEVKILDEDDALRLFSLHAFKQDRPIEGYAGLSKTVVSCVKGIPLVLEVLGSSLYKKTGVEYWGSKVAQLRTNGGEEVEKCLELCYQELRDTEKKIFLDIACFFGRCKRDHLQQTLDLEERSGIDRLIDMCLIKIVQNKIWMHDVLVKLGKKIVHQENVDPRERSRLWQADDIYRVLTTQRTGSKVESISLNLLAITEEMILSPTAFEGMYNLRLLKIYYPPFLKDPSKEQIMNGKRVGIRLPGGLHFLSSELRFLYWYNYPLKSMPSNFFPKKPFQLEMPCSQLEQFWNEYQPLEILKLMNPPSSKPSLIDSDLFKVPHLEVLHPGIPSSIKYSTRLTTLELPRLESFYTLPSSIGCLSQLVRLNLSSCESLASLPDNIDELKSLVELDLYSCSKLASLPNSICKLKCLTKLNLGRQPKLASLPDNIGELRSLVELSLSSCSKLASLPDSIGELRSLEWLELYGCSELASLPDNIDKLKSLEWLHLRGCSGLASLPDNIGALKSLESLDLSDCSGLASLPDSIGALKSLESLHLYGCSGLASLPDSIGALKSLQSLDLKGCSGLASLPDNIGALKSLDWLHLYGCSGLASLPDSIGALKSLDSLHLYGCSGLASLPDSIGALKSIESLYLYGCSGLASLPDNIGALKSLEWLHLSGCSGLASLPDSIGALKSLKSLHLSGCSGLASLPDSIGALKSLEWLHLYGCSGLASLPNSIGALKSLKSLHLSGCSGLASLPDTIGALKSLQCLELSDCSGLASLPDSIGALKSLESLLLYGCSGLASLPDSIGALKSLEWLHLYGCSGLASLPDTIGALKSLKSLDLKGCSGLASLPDTIGALKSLQHLDLNGCSGLKSLPESIGELKRLTTLDLSGCLKLASLPNNIIDLEFKGLDKQHCYMLSGFQKVEEIASSTYKLGCHEFLNSGNSCVLKTQERLGSLVSLTQLRLSHIDFERIPASIKQLTKLSTLYLDDCKRLQCLPELPSTLQVLIASGCISLKSVASIFMQGDREYKAVSQEFNFSECLQLDQNSHTRIVGAAHLRIQRMATSLFYQEYHGKPLKEVRLCIPGSEVPEWFSYKNREGSLVQIQQPAHWHRGFTLCAVVSFGQSGERRPVNIKCECHLICKDGTQIDLSSYYYEIYEERVRSLWERVHVFIWSVHSKCFFKEASFQFKSPWGATDVVVACGVHPLFVNKP